MWSKTTQYIDVIYMEKQTIQNCSKSLKRVRVEGMIIAAKYSKAEWMDEASFLWGYFNFNLLKDWKTYCLIGKKCAQFPIREDEWYTIFPFYFIPLIADGIEVSAKTHN